LSGLDRLAAELEAEGGLTGAAVVSHDGGPTLLPPDLGLRTAAGPRAAGREAEYAVLVEAIAEGYLQHYDEGRVLRTSDPDLALLAGDRLYALGLAKLAALGDLDGIVALADVIARCAQAHAEGRPEDAQAAWEQGVLTVGGDGAPPAAA
jgi:hypothetical protein